MSYHEQSTILPRYSNGQLAAFTALGGYNLFYITRGNDALCVECARRQEVNERAASHNKGLEIDSQFRALSEQEAEQVRLTIVIIPNERIAAAEINYEDCNLWCDSCSAKIAASYLDDDDCNEQEAAEIAAEQEAALVARDNSAPAEQEAEQVTLTQWELAAHSRIKEEAERAYAAALKARSAKSRKPLTYNLPPICRELVNALGLHDRLAAEQEIKRLLGL